jgi:carbon monoxide dehydrogenase subunit G
MAKFQISESIEINRPAETVFQYVTDISQAPSWRPNLSVRNFSGEPVEVGTTWSDVTKFMGRDMVVDVEVTALEAGRSCEMKQEGGVLSANTTWNISPGADDSSTFTLNFDGEISGWLAGLASGVLRSQAQKAMKRDLANLKSNLESS